MICQGRLGTDLEETLGNSHVVQHINDDRLQFRGVFAVLYGAENAFLWAMFIAWNDQFTNTGSEQAWEKLTEKESIRKGVFCRADPAGSAVQL
jgi:hypothetical protein